MPGVYDWVKIDKDGNEIIPPTNTQTRSTNCSTDNTKHKELENTKEESRLTECDSDEIVGSS